MKSVESWVTLALMAAILLLVVTHAGGFSTDIVAGGGVLDRTITTIGGQGQTAGVNVPAGVSSLNLAA